MHCSVLVQTQVVPGAFLMLMYINHNADCLLDQNWAYHEPPAKMTPMKPPPAALEYTIMGWTIYRGEGGYEQTMHWRKA